MELFHPQEHDSKVHKFVDNSEITRCELCILDAINKAATSWGIICLRYEIRDIKMPERVAEAMQLQVEAERNKRAKVLESEGKCTKSSVIMTKVFRNYLRHKALHNFFLHEPQCLQS